MGLDNDWDHIFYGLPGNLQAQIVEATHGTIILAIKVFKDKPKDFLIDLIPKLKLLTALDNEVIFEKGD